ncbi:hypothetical protein GGR54DRAFT_620567 [Hypoxylon sp. NC1633]|nr:hypothetical protein GGR54DRAFT_620567 [Hypoxylon sp. NC1633]
MMDERWEEEEIHHESNHDNQHAWSQATQSVIMQPTLATPEDAGRSDESRQATQSRHFTFVLQDPESGNSISDKPAPMPWSKKFLENIPKTREDWDEQRELLGITDDSGILKVFDYLTSWDIRIYPERTVRQDRESLPDELAFMASGPAAEKGIISPKKVDKLRSFFSLVFTAGLCVATQTDSSIDFGGYLSQHYSFMSGKPCRAIPPSQMKRYQRAIRWLVNKVEEKWMQGAEFLAPEWIVHANAPLSMYESWMRNTSTPDPFQPDLPGEEINAALPLHIPICVMFAFRSRFTYASVCAALGSKLFTEEDWKDFSSKYTSRSLTRCLCRPFSGIRHTQVRSKEEGLKFIPAGSSLLQAIYKASRQGNWDQCYENGRWWERSSTRDDQQITQIICDEWADMVSGDQASTSVRILCKDSRGGIITVHQSLSWAAGVLILPGSHALHVMGQELTFLVCDLDTTR